MDTKANLIAQLAMEAEVTDPIDWGMLSVSEQGAYQLMAMHVLEMDLSDDLIARSIITKLLVENFVLNMKLLDNIR